MRETSLKIGENRHVVKEINKIPRTTGLSQVYTAVLIY